MKQLTIIKCVCILMFLIIAILNVVSIVTYWRNVHNQLDTTINYGTTNITFGAIQDPRYEEDEVIRKIGIIDNCKNVPPNAADIDIDCTVPDGHGFVGDAEIVIMLALAIVYYFFNILITIVSMFLRVFSPRALYILPLICFIATVFMIIAIVIAAIYRNTVYAPWDGKNQLPNISSDFKVKDDSIIGPSSLRVTFAEGFTITIVNTVLSFFTICAAGFLACKNINDENEIVSVIVADLKVDSVRSDFDAPPPTISSHSK